MHGPAITPDTFDPEHLMRSWSEDGFLLELFETGFTDRSPGFGHTAVGYRLFDVEYAYDTGDADVIFQGTDYGVPAHQTIDGDDAVRGILAFLSLRPGDTDAEFFDGDTQRQAAWRAARAEDLSVYTLDPNSIEQNDNPDDEEA